MLGSTFLGYYYTTVRYLSPNYSPILPYTFLSLGPYANASFPCIPSSFPFLSVLYHVANPLVMSAAGLAVFFGALLGHLSADPRKKPSTLVLRAYAPGGLN